MMQLNQLALQSAQNYTIDYPNTDIDVDSNAGTITINWNNQIPAGSQLNFTVRYPETPQALINAYVQNLDSTTVPLLDVSVDSVGADEFTFYINPYNPLLPFNLGTILILYVMA